LIEDTFTRSCGNVFADLELEDAEELLLRADLSMRVVAELRRRKITKKATASATGLRPEFASALETAKALDIPAEHLLTALRRLGCNVDIIISDPGSDEAKIAVRS
jgi:predicted XRE-type DNA-binding protein